MKLLNGVSDVVELVRLGNSSEIMCGAELQIILEDCGRFGVQECLRKVELRHFVINRLLHLRQTKGLILCGVSKMQKVELSMCIECVLNHQD